MEYLTTDDPEWKAKAQKLAEKKQPFDIHDLNIKGDTTFVIELAREYYSAEHFKLQNGRAELRPRE